MSYEGKNIVKNSVTLNEVTKANADALPNRDGKLLNVDGDLFKDNGTSLDKIVTHDAKSSKWGFVATTRRTVTDWTVTGTAAVGTSSLQGEPNVDSFQIDLTGAGDTASIIAVAPNSAVDARSNLVTINYLLYNQTEAVRATFLDWGGNQVGVMDLPATGSGVATTDNLRWAYKSTDIMLPKVHGNTDNEITVKFTSTSGIDVGTFYVNNIQFDSNAGVSGEWVDTQSLYIETSEATFGSTNTGVLAISALLKKGGDILEEVTNATDGTYLEALKPCTVNLSAGFLGGSNGASVYTTLNSATLTTGVLAAGNYLSKSTVFTQGPYGELGTNIKMEVGDKLRIQRGSAVTYTFDNLTINATSNHRGVVKEGNPYDANETWLNVNADGTIAESRFGTEDANTTKDGLESTKAGTGRYEIDYTSMGLGSVPNFSADSLGLGSVSIHVTSATNTTATVIPRNLGTGAAINWPFSLVIKKNYPDADNSRELLIPNHVTRLNGQEYPVMGDFVELIDGTRYQVYERAWADTGGTLPTIDVGLVPVGRNHTYIGTDLWAIKSIAAGSANYKFFRYNDVTGALSYTAAGYARRTGEIFSMKYYDPDKPL